jgi:hypothetical protein
VRIPFIIEGLHLDEPSSLHRQLPPARWNTTNEIASVIKRALAKDKAGPENALHDERPELRAPHRGRNCH